MMRLFVGIKLPEQHKQTLNRFQNGLPDARWTAPENLHLTLRFIGEIEEPQAEDLHDALMHVSAPAFPLKIAGAGYFASGKRPRTLWAGVENAEAGLDFLQSKIERAAQKSGLEPEGRRFTPHVTLGRVTASPMNRLDAYVADNAALSLPVWTVEYCTRFESTLGKSQASYRALADYPLIGAML